MDTTELPTPTGTHWSVGDRGAAHLLRPGRKALCGTPMGYGNLHTPWPGTRSCTRCRTIAEKALEAEQVEAEEAQRVEQLRREYVATEVRTSSQAGLASFVGGPVHQPRERAVPCHRCGYDTLEVHAVCSKCGPETCSRCEVVL